MTPAILIVWTDIAPERETDFNEWYKHEHLTDRVGRMPGFLRGRRYEACDALAGVPKFLTFHDLSSATAMQSDAHVALRQNRSARDRFLCRVLNTRSKVFAMWSAATARAAAIIWRCCR